MDIDAKTSNRAMLQSQWLAAVWILTFLTAALIFPIVLPISSFAL